MCTHDDTARADVAPTAAEPSGVGKRSRGDGRSQVRRRCGWWTVQWQFHAFSGRCLFPAAHSLARSLARSPPVLASLSSAKRSLPVDTQTHAQGLLFPPPQYPFPDNPQEFDSPMARGIHLHITPPRQHMINHNGCALEISKGWKMHKIPNRQIILCTREKPCP